MAAISEIVARFFAIKFYCNDGIMQNVLVV